MRTDPKPERITGIITPCLFLLIPYFSFIFYHTYPIWTPEVWGGILGLCLIGAAVGWLSLALSSRLRAMLYAVLIVICLDITVGARWFDSVTLWKDGDLIARVIMLLVINGILFLSIALHTHIVKISLVMCGTVLFSTLALPVKTISAGEQTAQRPASAKPLPPVIHIILDEHSGVSGLPVDLPGYQELQSELKALYQRHGFQLYGQAFSHYAGTKESIPALLNGSNEPMLEAHVEREGERISVARNAWFEQLQREGYNLRVYQSDYLDYCSTPGLRVDYCLTYSDNSVHSLVETELEASDKARLLLHRFIRYSLLYRFISRGSDESNPLIGQMITHNEARYGAIHALPIIDQMLSDIQRYPQGTAFFAHLLIPHASYMYDAQCQLNLDTATWLRTQPFGSENSAQSRRIRYGLYLDQMRCTNRLIDRFLTELTQQTLLDDARVIVHGDHGSRITINRPTVKDKSLMTASDLHDIYSTLMAIRSGDADAGYSDEKRSIQSIFADRVLGKPIPDTHTDVYLKPHTLISINSAEAIRTLPMP